MVLSMKHPLPDWLERNNVTLEAFAQRVGASRMHLWRLIKGKGNFTTDFLNRVSDATGGEVTVGQLAAALKVEADKRKAEKALPENERRKTPDRRKAGAA
jgi:transcriptional regulator with XRE-family HTH domain